jgi:glycogen debranching enzyme
VSEQLIVLDGSTFFVTDDSGDIRSADDASGFFFADVRHLSMWQLKVNGEPIRLLSRGNLKYFSARVFGTLATARVGENPPVSFQRDRAVADGMHEDLYIDNNGEKEVRLTVEYEYAADFADIFEIKERLIRGGKAWVESGEDWVCLWWERKGFRRGTMLEFRSPGEIGMDRAKFEAVIAPRSRWHLCIDVSCMVEDKKLEPQARCTTGLDFEPKLPLSMKMWLAEAPEVESDWDAVSATYRQSLADLVALRFKPSEELSFSLPAAGLPWFMALFGRDSLITAYQVLPFQRRLAHATLEMLAATQAKDFDDYRDAEPGKILHEIRYGKLAMLGEIPHSPYYGSHDSTPLFLILLDELERWSGEPALIKKLEPEARAAVEWIRRQGDIDGDGYLEYQSRSAKGLVNQCWKDSHNSILFTDGRIASPPIATCEIQGYAYDALLRTSRLARDIWKDDEFASQLHKEAMELKDRFNKDFWNGRKRQYALALDGDKKQVDSLTSNVGHLLWSGIVPEDRAKAVVSKLMSREMFSGWGIRTMSMKDKGYNPIEYHNGTVWPHDTSIIAEGMRRYGFREEASLLGFAMIEAAARFSYRLPEVFAGFPREETEIPVQYPTASRPQAWAAGAPLLALRTILGMDVVDGRLEYDPHMPEGLGGVKVVGLHCRGKKKTISAR